MDPVSSPLSSPSAAQPPSASPIATAANNVPRGRGLGLPVAQNGHEISSVTNGHAHRRHRTSSSVRWVGLGLRPRNRRAPGPSRPPRAGHLATGVQRCQPRRKDMAPLHAHAGENAGSTRRSKPCPNPRADFQRVNVTNAPTPTIPESDRVRLLCGTTTHPLRAGGGGSVARRNTGATLRFASVCEANHRSGHPRRGR